MTELIRNVRKQEWDDFICLLERSYGFRLGYFQASHPDIYNFSPGCEDRFFVIEEAGRLVANLGMFPLSLRVEDVQITVGDIGGVATLPGERNKGYMEKLLLRAIAEMQVKKIPVSFLSGDRQRYGEFGWETAGERMVVNFSERSLTKTGVKPISDIREVPARQMLPQLAGYYARLYSRIERGDRLEGILSGNRVWVTDDGYLCGNCGGGKLFVREVVSLSGNEAAFILAVMQWCFVKDAETAICPNDRQSVSKFIRSASDWCLKPAGMFRINDCFAFIQSFRPLLERRAVKAGLPDFSISIGLQYGDKTDVIGLDYKSNKLSVTRQKHSAYFEFDQREWVRLLLGGPSGHKDDLGIFSALLPLPVHVPDLDRL